MTSERDLERRLREAFQSDHSGDATSLHEAAMARARLLPRQVLTSRPTGLL